MRFKAGKINLLAKFRLLAVNKMWRLCIVVCLTFIVCRPVQAIIGEEAKIKEFPFQVSLNRGSDHICGGVILNATIILTSAHCIEPSDAEFFYVKYGKSETRGDDNLIQVQSAIVHPLFNKKVNDIALIFLTSPIQFSENAQPAKLPTKHPRLGTTCTISGWGETRDMKEATYLQKATIQILENLRCEKEFKDIKIGKLLANRICAGSETADSCKGDSGGPLYSTDGELVGLIDGGRKCYESIKSNDYKLGVYTNVFHYLNWIKKELKW